MMEVIQSFFDPDTFTISYVVSVDGDAVVIDPVLDFDPASGKTATRSLKKLLEYVREKNLSIHYILETHAHADHLSAAQHLRDQHFKAARIGIGDKITLIQQTFKILLNLPEAFATDGSQFQRLFADNEIVEAGKIRFKVIYTPGHTPACVSYLFSNSVFVGDVLFMPDYGVGRCDFPNGDAEALYDSITKRLFTLPDATAVYVCHDYQPGGRALQYQTTIGETKVSNIQLNATTKAGDFVRFRRTRDATLSAPRLLYPSIQVNIAAGRLPDKEKNGQAYLKLPIFNS